MEISTSKSLVPVPKDFKAKSFWDKPEGTTGMVMLALLVFGGGFIFFPVLMVWLGMLIALMANIYVAVGMVAGIALLGFIATRSRTWTLGKILFKGFSRWITYKVIRCDPFGTLHACRDSIAKLYDSFSSQVDALHGKKNGLKKVIDENAGKQEKAANLAKKALERNEKSEAKLQGNQFMRLQQSNQRLAKVYNLMQILEAALKKYQQMCDEYVRDLDNEIDVQQAEYEAVETSYSAIQTAKKILMGGTDEREVLGMTMDYLAQNYEGKMGAIEGFLEQSQSMISGFDLQHALDDEKAMKAIEAWTKKGDQLLLEHTEVDFLPDLSIPGLYDTNKTPDYIELLNKHS